MEELKVVPVPDNLSTLLEELANYSSDTLQQILNCCKEELKQRGSIRARKDGLRTHQIRVLRTLLAANGPLTRTKLAVKCDLSSTVVSRALGYEDPDRRANFEANDPCGGYPSLITLGYVNRHCLDIDGDQEVCYEVNVKGRRALSDVADVQLPPAR